jgi:polyhydroxybutyrate depolymerase
MEAGLEEGATMKRGRWLLLGGALLIFAALSGFAAHARRTDKQAALRVDGRERTYTYHLPSGYDGARAVPLVLALHGRLGRGEERLSQLDKISDERGFLVVYPDGLDRSWADGRGDTPSDRKDVDDVKFLSKLIDQMEAEFKVHASRIYVTGMSNDGFMSGRLACQLSDRIAAVAIVAASLSETVAASCHPEAPVSVLVLQGTEDPLVPLAGGALGRKTAAGVVRSHDATVAEFAKLDGCSNGPKKERISDHEGDGTTIDVAIYSGCAGESEVRGYVVNGGGHAWPGGMQYLPPSIIGKTSKNMDASEVIWEFFATKQRIA